MQKIRVIIFIITIFVVTTGGYFASLYARGYRLNWETKKFSPSGLLIVKSNPEGSPVYVNGELMGATNSNLSLPPGNYDLEVKKEGYHTWSKRITIEKEVVTEIDAYLFKLAPSLSAMTLTETISPLPSPDFTKIAYIVPATTENVPAEKEGLWILETVNLPLGFANDPRRVTNGDLKDASIAWSPDGRQIILNLKTGSYLLDASSYTPQIERVNIASKLENVLKEWQEDRKKKFESQLRGLPEELTDILKNKTQKVLFSADESKILYLSDSEATLFNNLIKPVPGSSTQKQERNIKANSIYVYDIKEDRNFYIDSIKEDTKTCPQSASVIQLSCNESLAWFRTSRHILYAQDGKISILDLDGTNKQEIYSGSYVSPLAFPSVSDDRIIILTNLGANSDSFNLYSLSIK